MTAERSPTCTRTKGRYSNSGMYRTFGTKKVTIDKVLASIEEIVGIVSG